MKRYLILALLFVVGCATLPRIVNKPMEVIIYAQSLPTVVHAVWTPNAATDNVTNYLVTLDANAPLSTSPVTCTAVQCSQAITINDTVQHGVVIAAQNLLLSTDPTSLQTGSPTAVVTFRVNVAPGQVKGGGITH